MSLIYCVAKDASIVATLQERYRVLLSLEHSYELLQRKIAAAAKGAIDRPDAVVIFTDVAMNHTSPRPFQVAQFVRDQNELEGVRVVVVDRQATSGGIYVYFSEDRLVPVSKKGQLPTLIAQGGVPVVPYTAQMLDLLGDVLGLEARAAPGYLILCGSYKGGVGKTTTSCGLAVGLRDAMPNARVVVVDLDVSKGDLRQAAGLSMQVADSASLFDHSGQLTEAVILDHLSYHEATGVGILPAPPQTGFLDVDCGEWLEVVDTLRGPFDFVIVDLPPRLDDLSMEFSRKVFRATTQAALLIAVLTPSPFDREGIRRMRDSIAQTPEVRVNQAVLRDRMQVVVNNYDPDLRSYYGRPEEVAALVENELLLPVLGVIPRDVEIIKAQEEGRLFPTTIAGALLGARQPPAWQAMQAVTRKIVDRVIREEDSGEGLRRVRRLVSWQN